MKNIKRTTKENYELKIIYHLYTLLFLSLMTFCLYFTLFIVVAKNTTNQITKVETSVASDMSIEAVNNIVLETPKIQDVPNNIETSNAEFMSSRVIKKNNINQEEFINALNEGKDYFSKEYNVPEDIQSIEIPPLEDCMDKYNKVMYISSFSGLNLRCKANEEADIINTLPYSSQVNVVAHKDGWAKLDDGTFVSEEYLQEENPMSQWKSLGVFRLTAYCNCKKCCGKWAGGPTASGTMPCTGRTIAVDKKVIPLGSEVMINGHIYIAEDTGSGIKGNRIDVYMDDHGAALHFGVQNMEVFVK